MQNKEITFLLKHLTSFVVLSTWVKILKRTLCKVKLNYNYKIQMNHK